MVIQGDFEILRKTKKEFKLINNSKLCEGETKKDNADNMGHDQV